MIYLLLGPPGAGKTTQLERLTTELKLTGFSLGTVLRQQAPRTVRDQISRGQLAPHDLALKLVDQALKKHFAGPGRRPVVFDSFPKHSLEADWLIRHYGQRLGAVFFLAIDRQQSDRRLSRRARTDDSQMTVVDRSRIFAAQEPQLVQTFLAAGKPIYYLNGAADQDWLFYQLKTALTVGLGQLSQRPPRAT